MKEGDKFIWCGWPKKVLEASIVEEDEDTNLWWVYAWIDGQEDIEPFPVDECTIVHETITCLIE